MLGNESGSSERERSISAMRISNNHEQRRKEISPKLGEPLKKKT